MYEDSTKLCNRDNILLIFQSILKNIPEWDNDILQTETQRIISSSKFSNLEKLLKVILKLHIQIFTSNPTYIEEFMNVTFSKFIHICYITISKELYQYPDLLYLKDKESIDKRNNIVKINEIIKNGIEYSIKKLLPIDILLDEELEKKLVDTVTSEKSKNSEQNNQIYNLQQANNVLPVTNNSIRNSNNSPNQLNNIQRTSNVLNSLNNKFIGGGNTKTSDKKSHNTSDKKSYNSSDKKSHNTSDKKSYNSSDKKSQSFTKIKPQLVNDSILESAYSNVSNSTNTNAIINKIKSDPTVMSSDKVK